MTIVDYYRNDNMIVEFQNGYKTKAAYNNFKKGHVKNPYDKTIYGIGFVGEGIHNSKDSIYIIWISMFVRCYDKTELEKHPTYIDCSVCEEWHNFQNFIDWYHQNYYEIEIQTMNLDKDILYKGNKIYSPNTCVFVPQNINKLFTKRDNDRGKYPIGVTWNKQENKYRAQCNNGKGKQIQLGSYDNIEEAFNIYKKFKEKLIIQIANEYKDKIPKRLYNALCNYKVAITD